MDIYLFINYIHILIYKYIIYMIEHTQKVDTLIDWVKDELELNLFLYTVLLYKNYLCII